MSNSNGLTEAMAWLGEQPDTLFLGQGVGCSGTKMSASLGDVPQEKRIEFPVAENLQLGVSIGLSLEGFTPISVFPRWNFLLCAMDQLVNHLDKLPLYSGYNPKVIIRTAVGKKHPLDAGPQHTSDLTGAVAAMLDAVPVIRLRDAEDAMSVYKRAYTEPSSRIVVE